MLIQYVQSIEQTIFYWFEDKNLYKHWFRNLSFSWYKLFDFERNIAYFFISIISTIQFYFNFEELFMASRSWFGTMKIFTCRDVSSGTWIKIFKKIYSTDLCNENETSLFPVYFPHSAQFLKRRIAYLFQDRKEQYNFFSQNMSRLQTKFERHKSFIFICSIQTEWIIYEKNMWILI